MKFLAHRVDPCGAKHRIMLELAILGDGVLGNRMHDTTAVLFDVDEVFRTL